MKKENITGIKNEEEFTNDGGYNGLFGPFKGSDEASTKMMEVLYKPELKEILTGMSNDVNAEVVKSKEGYYVKVTVKKSRGLK